MVWGGSRYYGGRLGQIGIIRYAGCAGTVAQDWGWAVNNRDTYFSCSVDICQRLTVGAEAVHDFRLGVLDVLLAFKIMEN